VRSVIVAVLLVFSASVAGQNPPSSPLRELVRKLERERTAGNGPVMYAAFVAGQAYLTANYALAKSNLPPLYCQPDKLGLRAANYADFALTAFHKNEPYYYAGWANHAEDGLATMLLDGLRATFPCK